MKFKSILSDKVSGAIGSLAGATGSGGSHFRRKIKTNTHRSIKKDYLNKTMREANIEWAGMATEVKEAWGLYGKSLVLKNNTDYNVKQAGWTAFNSSYLLMKGSNMNINQILTNAPEERGYLEPPVATFFIFNNRWRVTISNVGFMGISSYISPKFKNTINSNTKEYNFYVHHDFNFPGSYYLPVDFKDGRFFVKFRVINLNGSISLPKIYKVDAT